MAGCQAKFTSTLLATLALKNATDLGAVTLERLQRLAVQPFTVQLSRSTVVLLLRVVGHTAVLVEECQLNTRQKHNIIITNTRTLNDCHNRKSYMPKPFTGSIVHLSWKFVKSSTYFSNIV